MNLNETKLSVYLRYSTIFKIKSLLLLINISQQVSLYDSISRKFKQANINQGQQNKLKCYQTMVSRSRYFSSSSTNKHMGNFNNRDDNSHKKWRMSFHFFSKFVTGWNSRNPTIWLAPWAGGLSRSCPLIRAELLRDELCNAFFKHVNIYILTYRHGFRRKLPQWKPVLLSRWDDKWQWKRKYRC